MKAIGWLEMTVRVPDDWDLVAESGGLKEAYMKFDSIDRVRLELKWERTKKKGEALPIIALENYIKEVTKSVKDKKSVKVVDKGGAKVADHKASYYIWNVKDESYITACWVCQHEGKVVLLQYYLAPGEDKSGQFEELLRNVECHPVEEFYPYRLFGVSFKVPKGFVLSKRKLLVGKANISLASGGSTLYLSWIGMAKEQLRKHKSLGDLFRSTASSELRSIGDLWTLAKRVKDADEDIDLTSESGGRIPFLSSRKKNRLRVYLDKDLNKIFISGYSCKLDQIEKADTFIRSVEGYG